MKLNKKQTELLNHMIEEWQRDDILTDEVADRLKHSYHAKTFDWKRLAKYSFWISIACGVISIGAIITDSYLMALFEKIFSASDIVKSIFFAGVAALVYVLGFKRRAKKPKSLFSNEAIIFVGVLFTAVSIAYLGAALDTGSGHFSILFLLSTAIYAILGFCFPSKLVWIFSLLSLGSWFGTETGYQSGWGAYFLGMNYPLRFVLFGAILVALSMLFKKNERLSFFYESTYVVGLLYLFIALWILSIFGNYGDMESWYDVKQIELFHWGLIFAAVALATIYYGLKQGDHISRSFGITFLFLNLYTKFFEYFWNETHKAIFFIILAISFWLIGRRAEKIWHLEFLKFKEGSNEAVKADKEEPEEEMS